MNLNKLKNNFPNQTVSKFKNKSSHHTFLLDNNLCKVNIYNHNIDKDKKSLSTYKFNLEKTKLLPEFVKLIESKPVTYLVTKWFDGKSIHDQLKDHPKTYINTLEKLCDYILDLYNSNMCPVDNHLKNFFINKDNMVMYIDLKKIWPNEKHLERICKLLLKNFYSNENYIIAFLKHYSKRMPIKPVLDKMEESKWSWHTASKKKIIVDKSKILNEFKYL
jgi:hypothetical protein